MDHLSLGIGIRAKLGAESIICYCKDIWNGTVLPPHNFYTFPNGEFGWKIHEKTHGLVEICDLASINEDLEQSEAEQEVTSGEEDLEVWDETRFVQRWLFFGLLHQLFQNLPGFRLEDFVTDGDSRFKYITTEPLQRVLKQWELTLRDDEQQRWSRMDHAQRVLAKARECASSCLAVYESGTTVVDYPVKWTKVNGLVAMSILILGETLSGALRQIQTNLKFTFAQWSHIDALERGWGYSRIVLKGLNENGWEPDAIEFLRIRLKESSTALLVVLAIQNPNRLVIQKDSNYQTHHFCEGQDKICDAIQINNLDEYKQILNHNKVPLFRYDKTNRILTVEERRRESKYVVVSHVWGDGFGNPAANAMNRCVLETLLDSFKSMTKGMRPKTTLFWIDTLGIPVHENFKDQRKMAIRNMYEVYIRAQMTFVFDKSIMRFQMGRSYTTAALQLSLSNWNRRLWTFQEAVLSKKLAFSFDGGASTIEDVENLLENESNDLQSCMLRHVAQQYTKSILWGTHHQGIRDNDVATTQTVGAVWKAMQWRRTTHAHHETLALATIFNLETERFWDVSNQRDTDVSVDLDVRMKCFLELLATGYERVPPELIFQPPPYLAIEGYRWAPKSWLCDLPAEHPDYYPIRKKGGVPWGEGLAISLSGFVLHDLQKNLRRLRTTEEFHFCTEHECHHWFRVSASKDSHNTWPIVPPKYQNKELVIICLSEILTKRPQTAVLAVVTKKPGTRRKAIILGRINICREGDPEVLRSLREKCENPSYRPVCYGQALPQDHEWIIDRIEQRQAVIDDGNRIKYLLNRIGMGRYVTAQAPTRPNETVSVQEYSNNDTSTTQPMSEGNMTRADEYRSRARRGPMRSIFSTKLEDFHGGRH